MEKQNVLITGASRGLGLELGQRLLNEGGYNVFGTATSDRGLMTMEEAGINPYKCNFNSPDSIEQVIQTVGESVDNLDFLVNNVGIGSRMNLADMTNEHIHEVFSANIIGHIIATREAIKHMSQGGNIVFMNSTAGLDPCGGASGYVATKQAMTGFTDSIRYELQNKAGVSDIFLGGMDTNFHTSPRPELMDSREVAEEIYRIIFKGIQRGEKMSKDVLITSERDNRRPVDREAMVKCKI